MTPKYKRMIAGMKKNGKADWAVYILRCSDGSLYTGTTNDIDRRVKMHNAGQGAKYTKTRRPVTIVFQKKRMTRSQALIRECAIKSLPKKEKEALVSKRRKKFSFEK